VTDSKNNFGP